MKITVSRQGGVAAIVRTWHVDVDAEKDLPTWTRIVDACPWNEPLDLDGDGLPDRFIYVIVVDTRRARVPEQQLTGPWRELVDRVQQAQMRR